MTIIMQSPSTDILQLPYIALVVAASFIFSFLLIKVLAPLAVAINLVDTPTARKLHRGSVPLIGGVGVFVSSLLTVLLVHAFLLPITESVMFVWLCGALLTIVGVIDDNRELSARLRIMFQLLVAVLLISTGDTLIESLGVVWNEQALELKWAGPVFTLIAIVGVINAFNMVDGIDGLLGGLSLITFLSVGVLTIGVTELQHIAVVSFIIVGALAGFLCFNLGSSFGKIQKVFMGDAGSMVLGLFVAWTLVQATQGTATGTLAFEPVTALWLAAVPLIDLFTTVLRRGSFGYSPFQADRLHCHHLIFALTGSARRTLVVMLVASGCFAFIGVLLERLFTTTAVSLVVFLLLNFVYFFASRAFIKKRSLV